MVICHRTPSGQEQTMDLPIPAAMAHIRNHPLDTVGPCQAAISMPEEIVIEMDQEIPLDPSPLDPSPVQDVQDVALKKTQSIK
jgi:hypothetical protein